MPNQASVIQTAGVVAQPDFRRIPALAGPVSPEVNPKTGTGGFLLKGVRNKNAFAFPDVTHLDEELLSFYGNGEQTISDKHVWTVPEYINNQTEELVGGNPEKVLIPVWDRYAFRIDNAYPGGRWARGVSYSTRLSAVPGAFVLYRLHWGGGVKSLYKLIVKEAGSPTILASVEMYPGSFVVIDAFDVGDNLGVTLQEPLYGPSIPSAGIVVPEQVVGSPVTLGTPVGPDPASPTSWRRITLPGDEHFWVLRVETLEGAVPGDVAVLASKMTRAAIPEDPFVRELNVNVTVQVVERPYYL
jgi:hypothetical protein